MASIKIGSKVEQAESKALQDLAKESQQSISGLLTESISDYAMNHLEDSIKDNEELGHRLAR